MKNKKGFVWTATRYGFWSMIGLWVASIFLGQIVPIEAYDVPTGLAVLAMLIGFAWMVVSGFTFVNSIVHLTKHKKKAFAITSLAISSLCCLITGLALLAGVFAGVTGA